MVDSVLGILKIRNWKSEMGSGKLSNMEKLIITAKPRNGDFKVCFAGRN